jgi:hypothetical protein
MFEARVKSISISVLVSLILGAGPVACSGAQSIMPGEASELNLERLNGDYTIRDKDRPLVANLHGIKLVHGVNPHAHHTTAFDVAVEVQGVGLQLENDRNYAYVRADRVFTNEHRVGIRFRFQF